jgi:hypothetical protein
LSLSGELAERLSGPCVNRFRTNVSDRYPKTQADPSDLSGFCLALNKWPASDVGKEYTSKLFGDDECGIFETWGRVINMSDEEMRDRVIRLAFGGDPNSFKRFCDVLRAELPENTGAVLRGSSITGVRWNDGAPFDSDGPRTSDLDLTLVGSEVISLFKPDAFYIPLIHTKPLGDKDPDIAPDLEPLREKLQAMVGRPVNIQATRDFIRYVREVLLGEPHLRLIETPDSL